MVPNCAEPGGGLAAPRRAAEVETLGLRMGSSTRPGRLLGALCLAAWAPAAAAAVLDRVAASAARGAREDRYAALQPDLHVAAPDVGSTPAQDQQRCPLVQLSSDISLRPGYVHWLGHEGTWKTPNNIVLGSWRQNYFSNAFADVHIMNLDSQLAVQAVPTNDAELRELHSWRVTKSLSDFQPLADLEAKYSFAASAGGREAELAAMSIAPPVSGSNATDMAYRLCDCEGRLLFVVKLSAATLKPGTVDVYDQSGALVAHSLQDHASARLMFVDPRGYLLATAEAPALGQRLNLTDLARDPAMGGILPYQIRFEPGDYANASRLLDVHYRWALVSALQVKAIYDAEGLGAQPPVIAAISVAYWCMAALALIIILYLSYLVFRSLVPAAERAVWSKRM